MRHNGPLQLADIQALIGAVDTRTGGILGPPEDELSVGHGSVELVQQGNRAPGPLFPDRFPKGNFQ